MEISVDEAQDVSPNYQRLPWHKPEIERLTVSIDTAESIHSGPDGATLGLLLG